MATKDTGEPSAEMPANVFPGVLCQVHLPGPLVSKGILPASEWDSGKTMML